MKYLWLVWYHFFPIVPPWPGKGTRENPLEWSDIQPLLTMLRRIDY